MFEKFQAAENRYDEINHRLSDPAVIANQDEYKKLMKEHAELEVLVTKYNEYKKLTKEIADAKEMLNEKLDKEFREMVETELKEAQEKLEVLKKEMKILLLPKDPNDERNVIVEIRGGAGGDEAALFAGDLFRMYTRYAERNGWKTEILDSNPTEIGGFKEVVFSIEGNGAYSRLKFESGVHRVQRVPVTEANGRVHTSTVTVAVLPEAEEIDVEINPNDLRIDTYRASGAGGQHINKTDSAIRITHLPTGLVVCCQDQRSQHKNKEKAMKVLRSKLYEMAREQQHNEIAQERKSQVGTGDRSERIRTYNFPQGRVTDHRIGLTLYKIDDILDGDIDEIIDALITTDQASKLANGAEDDED
ncbi:MAG TPA: peptide chain release factor 1 [Hungateiclostridium thermocellum]|jgi:peptide chain release factor 1|uniref:Peptide chain release factor 1 n=2 Tax=Acetivibrio thermocellus TaxID=1515 RepID=RF1_ACET2|nr:peptide chain release factor 1 [Acetivibrio thermocellus]A3DIL4.1 RecName: Full=Peptide chain release factor 1; Short=RF-1 [Acetivibrio thermocellus ATCC 27405]CDG37056.1 Peptide chain release factor 1 [Acetivibrio thermocellus BC1]ABN53793.1 peptide chain release factor 1 [Acetivibrio thermocellus ATCC 27405]ADU73275.1 peptide chain release factor 1 [Acetivibrio thermocellus DSM 1313]ALX07193.1 Peptide chain release factor 1 [Acetivibrio thermocellus AD2]ANV74929.1 Peptide chain release f